VQKAFELLETENWKVEKITASNDTIYTQVRSIGKVYKLSARVNYPAKDLLKDLYFNIDDVPKWNPTLLESRVIRVRK
jgi:hypothetical protein